MPLTPSRRALDVLRDTFRLPDFRPGQSDVVAAAETGRDVLLVAPTGAGKSVAYWVPGLVDGGLTLIVSPLIALMTDQVRRLQSAEVDAGAIHSQIPWEEQRETRRRAQAGDLRFLYVAPERFGNRDFLANLPNLNVRRFIVDEAHCISSWGHDFRPDYRRLRDAIDSCGRPIVGAFTATATPQVRDDITRSLGLREPLIRVTGFVRPELRMQVVRCRGDRDKVSYIEQHVRDVQGRVIVYCGRVRTVDHVADMLRQSGIRAAAYHGQLDADTRTRVHSGFADGQVRVVVATSAFGMGVDLPDIRTVIHTEFPGSLEAYYQEAGRAGRDGQAATCTLLYDPADRELQNYFIEQAYPDDGRDDRARAELKDHALARVNQVMAYARDRGCRHARIADYFGQSDIARECTSCDNCTSQNGARPTVQVGQDDVRSTLACVARFDGHLGATRISAMLAGSVDAWTRERSWVQALPFFGALRAWQEARVRELLDTLIEEGYVQRNSGSRPTLSLAASGRNLLHGRVSAEIEMDAARVGTSAGTAKPTTSSTSLDGSETLRFDKLRRWRMQIARDQNVPAYVVLTDKTLTEIARRRPQSRTDLLQVPGMGPAKLQRYGDELLRQMRSDDPVPFTRAH